MASLANYVFTLVLDKDDANGNNVGKNVPIQIRTADAAANLVTIYSDADGLNPINQETSVTNSLGKFSFWAERGLYQVYVNNQPNEIIPVNGFVTYDSLEITDIGQSAQEVEDAKDQALIDIQSDVDEVDSAKSNALNVVIPGYVQDVQDRADQADNQIESIVTNTQDLAEAKLDDVGFIYKDPETFATGSTLSGNAEALLWSVDDGGNGEYYRWTGAFPKVVPANSTPASTGGVDEGAWKATGYSSLKQELASSDADKGALLVKRATVNVASVADLKASPATLGTIIETRGYYSSDDGGANKYIVVPAATGTDDGGSYIDMDSGLQAKGLFQSNVSAEQFGAVGDGVANDTLAFESLSLFSNGRMIVLRGGATYLVDSVSFPANCTLITNGAKFVFSGVGAGTNQRVINVSGSGHFRATEIRVEVPTGIVHQNMVSVSASTVNIDRIEAISADQQAYGNELLDGAVSITGDIVNVGSYQITNSDRAFIINGCRSVEVGAGEINSYRLGIWIENCDTIKIKEPVVKTASPNANFDPGNNGILMAKVRDVYIQKPIIEDAGEHGIRVGGGGGFNSDNITIDRPKVLRPGRNGIKIRPDEANKANNVWILFPEVVDAGFGSTASGNNKNGLLLERCVYATVIEPRIIKDQRAVSAVRGIECFDVNNIRIVGGYVYDPAENSLFVTSVGNDDSGSTIYKDINDLSVSAGFRSSTAGQSGILVDYQNAKLRNLDIDCVVTDSGNFGFELRDDSGLGAIQQRGSLKIRSNGDSSGAYGGSGLEQSRMLIDVASSVIEGFVGSDGVTGNNLPHNVSISKVATGIYDIVHNLGFGDSNLIPNIIAYDANVYPSIIANADINTLRVRFKTGGGTDFDTDFFFEIRSNGRSY
jgi:hypothetical protein